MVIDIKKHPSNENGATRAHPSSSSSSLPMADDPQHSQRGRGQGAGSQFQEYVFELGPSHSVRPWVSGYCDEGRHSSLFQFGIFPCRQLLFVIFSALHFHKFPTEFLLTFQEILHRPHNGGLSKSDSMRTVVMSDGRFKVTFPSALEGWIHRHILLDVSYDTFCHAIDFWVVWS